MVDKESEAEQEERELSAEETRAEANLKMVESVVNTPESQLSSMTNIQPNVVVPLAMTETYEVLTEVVEQYINQYAAWMRRHEHWLEEHKDFKDAQGRLIVTWGPPLTDEELEAQNKLSERVSIHLTKTYRLSVYKHRRSVGGIQRMAVIDLAKEQMAMEQPEQGPREPDWDEG